MHPINRETPAPVVAKRASARSWSRMKSKRGGGTLGTKRPPFVDVAKRRPASSRVVVVRLRIQLGSGVQFGFASIVGTILQAPRPSRGAQLGKSGCIVRHLARDTIPASAAEPVSAKTSGETATPSMPACLAARAARRSAAAWSRSWSQTHLCSNLSRRVVWDATASAERPDSSRSAVKRPGGPSSSARGHRHLCRKGDGSPAPAA